MHPRANLTGQLLDIIITLEMMSAEVRDGRMPPRALMTTSMSCPVKKLWFSGHGRQALGYTWRPVLARQQIKQVTRL
ncbi:MAG: hypothetical protein H6714_05000 [Myxococcales bacterium]|nr:hypothetical protein [Myxococcales bacterium]